jgi:hypothetical protein
MRPPDRPFRLSDRDLYLTIAAEMLDIAYSELEGRRTRASALPKALVAHLDRVHALCRKSAGCLCSRQVIAAIVDSYRKKEDD